MLSSLLDSRARKGKYSQAQHTRQKHGAGVDENGARMGCIFKRK